MSLTEALDAQDIAADAIVVDALLGSDCIMTLGVLGDVVHQMSPHRALHRLCHIDGSRSGWMAYTAVATLSVGDDLYIATTDYHRGGLDGLPAIGKLSEWKDHE